MRLSFNDLSIHSYYVGNFSVMGSKIVNNFDFVLRSKDKNTIFNPNDIKSRLAKKYGGFKGKSIIRGIYINGDRIYYYMNDGKYDILLYVGFKEYKVINQNLKKDRRKVCDFLFHFTIFDNINNLPLSERFANLDLFRIIINSTNDIKFKGYCIVNIHLNQIINNLSGLGYKRMRYLWNKRFATTDDNKIELSTLFFHNHQYSVIAFKTRLRNKDFNKIINIIKNEDLISFSKNTDKINKFNKIIAKFIFKKLFKNNK